MKHSAEQQHIALQHLIATEDKNLGAADRFLGMKTSVSDTAAFATKDAIAVSPSAAQCFKPAWGNRIWNFSTGLCLLLILILLLHELITGPYVERWKLVLGIFPMSLLVAAIFTAIKKAVKKRRICISKAGIELDGQLFPWEGITGTFFIKRPKKGASYQLVLVFTDLEMTYYDLGMYALSEEKFNHQLSACIMHFNV